MIFLPIIKTKKILAIVITFVFMVSCIEETDIELQSTLDEAIVVDVKITTDTAFHQAKLSKTADYYQFEQTPRATGANVIITSDAGDVFTFEEIEDGIYQTTEKIFGEIGREYFLTIEHEGEEYHAESFIRRAPNIDSIGFRWDPFMESYRVLYYGMDHPGRGDSYLWHIYKNGELMTDSLHKIVFTNDEMFDGQYIYGIEIDQWFNNFDLQPDDTVTVEMHGITEDAEAFLREIYLETGGSGPAGGSSLTPRGNISGKAFGLFYASSVVRYTNVIK